MARLPRLCVALVVVHAFVLMVHSAAHQALPVPLSLAQSVFAYAVVVAAPLVGGFLVVRGSLRAGGLLLGLSMLGAFVFGVVNHYVLESADHVSIVPAGAWGDVFRASAHALAALELAGTIAGFALAWGARRTAFA
ncbi:MAG TPA: hypothetical protein VMW35_18075 [Myxococcota bacterium]|nr:hypothetical protein [Myxococcota bacterium]